jgi:hypothetical protein
MIAQGRSVGEFYPKLSFLGVAASLAIWSERRKINYVDAEHAPEGRLVTPNT